MANQKEHGPHPFALLREWKLNLNPVINKQARTELEAAKLQNFLTDLLLFSPTLNAGKIQFTASFDQIREMSGVSYKTVYNRATRLKEMGILTWEQPAKENKGDQYKPTLWSVGKNPVGKIPVGKNDGGSVGKNQGVPSVKKGGAQEFTDGNFTDSGLCSDQSGQSTGQEEQHETAEEQTDSDQTPNPDLCEECGATPDACICESPVPPSIESLASRLESLVHPARRALLLPKLQELHSGLNGDGSEFLQTLDWFAGLREGGLLQNFFPTFRESTQGYSLESFLGVLPKIQARFRETHPSAVAKSAAFAYDLED